MNNKKIIAGVMLLVGIGLMIFGYWGAFTRAGNKVYDKMDAFLPFFLLIGGVILGITSLVLFMLIRSGARK